MQRVSPLNSNQTLLVNDYDFENMDKYFTDQTNGVMFSDIVTKPEFDFNLATGEVQPGECIIFANRTLATPQPNQTIAVKFTSDAVETVATTVGNKVYIELDDTLIQQYTDIVDIAPSTAFAQGLNIGQIKSTPAYPAHNNYIKLREINVGPSAQDMRVKLDIKGDNVNMVGMTRDIETSGSITASEVNSPQGNFDAINLMGSDLQTQLNDIVSGLSGTNNIITVTLGEPIGAYNVGFIGYDGIRTKEAVAQLTNNITVNFGQLTNNIVGQTFTNFNIKARPRFRIWLQKVGAPTDNVMCRVRDITRTTVISTSTTAIAGTTITGVYVEYVFEFQRDGTPLDQNTQYFLEIYRTGAYSDTAYYQVPTGNLNQYTGGAMRVNIGGVRVETPNNDLYFGYTPRYVDNLGYFSLKNYADSDICDFIALQTGVIGDTVNGLVAGANGGFSNLVPRQRYSVGADMTLSCNYLPNGNNANVGTVASQKYCDMFQIVRTPAIVTGKTFEIRQIKLKIRKVGTPTDDLQIRIETVSGVIPSGTLVDPSLYTQISGTSLTTGYVEYTLNRANHPSYVNVSSYTNTDMFLVVQRSGANDNVNYYQIESYSGIYHGQYSTATQGYYYGDNPKVLSRCYPMDQTTGGEVSYEYTVLGSGKNSCTCDGTLTLPADNILKQAKYWNGAAWVTTASFVNVDELRNFPFPWNYCGTAYPASPTTIRLYFVQLTQLGFVIDDIKISPSSNLDFATTTNYVDVSRNRYQNIVGMAVSPTTLVIDKR